MKCQWEEIDCDVHGKRRYKCVRLNCKTVAAPTNNPPERIGALCRGLPLAHETGYWIEFFASVLQVSRALAIVAFLRWRAKGSPLDELPPGVPKPGTLTPPAPDFGPGTELERIFVDAGAKSDQCGGVCKQWRGLMNRWGVVGCREHRREIVNRITEAAYKSWVTDQIKIGWSIKSESWFRYSDPVGCIVDESIRRAEAVAIERAAERA